MPVPTNWTDITYPFGSLLTSTKMTNNQTNFTGVTDGSSGAPKIKGAAVWTWPFPAGQYAAADYTFDTSTTIPGGVYNYGDLQVNSGVTVGVTPKTGPLIMMCRGNAKIYGFIDVSCAAGEYGYGLGGSGGHDGLGGLRAGPGLFCNGSIVGSGTNVDSRHYPFALRAVFDIPARVPYSGSEHISAYLGGGHGSGAVASRGWGGGVLAILCDDLEFSGGVFSKGGVPPGGSSGGGGGGCCLLAAATVTTNTGSHDVLGRIGAGAGWTGGTGIFLVYEAGA